MYEIQDAYQKAIAFAGEKHKHQKMPASDIPYMTHLSNVAMEIMLAGAKSENFDTAFAVQLAILHDTIEDTDTKYSEVESVFGEKVARGVFALTKEGEKSKEEQMEDSIEKILREPKEVGAVKMADRITNLQKPPKHWTKDKMEKYKLEAKYILEHLGSTNEYLRDRLEIKIENYKKFIKE